MNYLLPWHTPFIYPKNSCYSKIRQFGRVFSLWYRNAKILTVLWIVLVANLEILLKALHIWINPKASSSMRIFPFHHNEVFFFLNELTFLYQRCLKILCRNLLMKHLKCNLFQLQQCFPTVFSVSLFLWRVNDVSVVLRWLK